MPVRIRRPCVRGLPVCSLQAVCSGASGTVEHIDWSFALVHGPLQKQGRYILQSNDTSREVLHWDGLTGRKVTGNQRDCRWSTWTCTLGFPVLGIWPDFSDGARLHPHFRCTHVKQPWQQPAS
jgi:hypothetical protein